MTETMNKKNDLLFKQLKKNFGFDQFKDNQEEIIRSLLAGEDNFVLMPTGGGNLFAINYRPLYKRVQPLSYHR